MDLTVLISNDIQTEETRELSHLQFLAWPDYGVPHTATAMLSFLTSVREQQNRLLAHLGDTWAGHPRGPPIVVHCSAGIGRTGEQFHLVMASYQSSFIIAFTSWS